MNRRVALIGFVVLLLFTSGCSLVRPLPGVTHDDPPRMSAGGTIPGSRIPFIENRGQTNDAVKFYAPIADGTVFVTSSGEMTYALRHVVLTEALVGGAVQSVTGTRETPTKVNVLRGNDPAAWRTNLPTYDTISLGEVYAGIDVELQASGASVEKLFHVKAGADPARIRIAVTGGRGIAVTPQGELDVAVAKGTIRFTRPIAFQEAAGKREPVDVAYVVDGERYGFRLGTYDRSRRLVIDPVLKTTFLGGAMSDSVVAVVEDGGGNVYVAGYTASPDFPGVGAGVADPFIPFPNFDGFVAKLNADLSVVLVATFLGGGGDDVIQAMTLDGAGNLYVTGYTRSPDSPGIDSTSAYDSLNGFTDAFVARLDAGLTTVHSTYLGGADDEDARAIALDGTGSVFVAGATSSSDFPGVSSRAGSADSTFADGEGFVVKLDAGLGNILAATFLGGSASDTANAIAIDAAGRIYVAGTTDSADFPGVGAGSADSTHAGTFTDFEEGFVARLDASLGTIQAATFLGGSDFDVIVALRLDGTGNVYVAGSTGSWDFPGLSGGSPDLIRAGVEGFVAKLSPGLTNVMGATFLGGSGDDFVRGLAVNSAGTMYVVGDTILSFGTGGHSGNDFPGIAPDSAQTTFTDSITGGSRGSRTSSSPAASTCRS